MPSEESKFEFKVWNEMQRHPIVIYADFNALLSNKQKRKEKCNYYSKTSSHDLWIFGESYRWYTDRAFKLN